MSAATLDYGELKGYKPLRELIARRMRDQGFDIAAENLLVTFGSQQGIDIASRLFVDPADLVMTEAPTYIGAMQAFDAYEPTYLQVPVDAEGMDLELAERMVAESKKTPKLIYVIPNFQNPTGVTMSESRRDRLIELAGTWNSVIVEDDPYGEFWYDNPPPRQLRQRSDRVIYLGTFSKTMAPGLRVGWMALPDDLMGLAMMAKESSEVSGVRDVTRTVHAAADTFLDDHVAEARAFYATRRTAMVDALGEFMPDGVTWTHPGGGFFVWVTLPDGLTASQLLPIAAQHGVGFLPGRFFYPAAEGEDQSLRLSFSVLPHDRIREGIARLGPAISAAQIK